MLLTDVPEPAAPELGAPPVPRGRRCLAELVGTALLVAVVIGSGIAAQRGSTDVGLQLLENTAATVAGLTALILTFSSVSGARFNPLVSLTSAADGALPWREVPWEIAAQVTGGVAGAVVANLMFELPAVEWSTHERASGALWLGEVVATFGLLTVIAGVSRSDRPDRAAFAVAAYIGAAYWFTSSTSFANPAVTVARAFSDTFAGIAPSSVPAFVAAQCTGALAALALDRSLHPRPQDRP